MPLKPATASAVQSVQKLSLGPISINLFLSCAGTPSVAIVPSGNLASPTPAGKTLIKAAGGAYLP